MSRAAYARCGAKRSAFAVVEAIRPVWGGAVCVLAPGHKGLHRDRTGGGWFATPEIADAVAVSLLVRLLTDRPGTEDGS
ncbi:hypothetical protein [Streptomyces exfoliatus]|uniref:hypothetical protein n=1 Tax=Streptomyces exfoliatus TaxID=1905 RepID=UPI0004635C8F|nr:hypothetical protein [Streptomyces exfoliatus]